MTFTLMRRRSEKEKEEDIWRRKIFFAGKGNGGKYLEKENLVWIDGWVDIEGSRTEKCKNVPGLKTLGHHKTQA